MKRAIIITGYIEGPEDIKSRLDSYHPAKGTCALSRLADETEVICADKGWKYAPTLGFTPDYYIGDYDSSEKPPKTDNITLLQCEKDDTDTEAALNLALDHEADDVLILGGLGGRFDHTMGNIGILYGYTKKFRKLELMDGRNKVFMALPGDITVHKDGYKYLGIFAYGGRALGVTLEGFKYPLTDYDLDCDTSLGVSNEILGESARISLKEGALLIVQSNDK
ncbi:MAG: thiamine diphosphokinase [Eubacteriales bacterium]|nr:thiamine diphosphokinase [Eubacteriales bacterium]